MNVKNNMLCEKANQITLNLLTYGHAKVNPHWKGESIQTSYSYLYYIHNGEGVIITENKTTKLVAGNWYLIPSGCHFKYNCENQMEQIYFHIQLCGTDKLDMLRNFKEPFMISVDTVPDFFFKNIKNSDDILISLALKKNVYEIIIKILNQNNIKLEQPILSKCVQNAIEYISGNPSARMTTTEIAKNSFVSNSKLTKQFKKELSMSVQEYLYNILLSNASHLILNTKLSFLEISEKLGFSDQFYFSRKFKEKYGISPRKYKQQIEDA